MCPSGATRLLADRCFSELTLKIQLRMLIWYKADIVSSNVTHSLTFAIKKWPYKRGMVSLEEENLVVFYYLRAFEIW